MCTLEAALRMRPAFEGFHLNRKQEDVVLVKNWSALLISNSLVAALMETRFLYCTFDQLVLKMKGKGEKASCFAKYSQIPNFHYTEKSSKS